MGAGLTEGMFTWRRSGLLERSKVASDEGVFQVLISSKSQQRRCIKDIFCVSVSGEYVEVLVNDVFDVFVEWVVC